MTMLSLNTIITDGFATCFNIRLKSWQLFEAKKKSCKTKKWIQFPFSLTLEAKPKDYLQTNNFGLWNNVAHSGFRVGLVAVYMHNSLIAWALASRHTTVYENLPQQAASIFTINTPAPSTEANDLSQPVKYFTHWSYIFIVDVEPPPPLSVVSLSLPLSLSLSFSHS